VTTAARPPFDLYTHGSRPALLTADGPPITYADLAGRVDALLERLGPERRLILLRGGTSVEFVVALLAGLTGGHPVIVAPPLRSGASDELAQVYDPDIIIDADRGHVELRRAVSANTLHPDLALLMSTSGSTGSPKLVRLTPAGVRANAAAIATYLGLTPQDRGILTLPLHYCYGLSILTSHLYAGAATVVTEWSVLDPCLWELAAEHGATGLAGVPHTFDQLDQLGFPEVPSLRYVTVAGGKLAPERVTGYLELGDRRGWEFVVMYGQTEATARMAYLPPELARRYPQAVGVPIPGGSLRLEQPDEHGVGELVYAGPNVMMGYAQTPQDLARGRDQSELRTGDLAREVAPDVFEVVGRTSRFAKVFGLRVDLDEVERHLPMPAVCVEIDDELGVVSPDADAATQVAELCDLPTWAVRAVAADVPYLASGKPDRQAASALLTRAGDGAARRSASTDVRALYQRLLGRADVEPGDSFVSMGADSLSYVELSVRLGELIDPLPRDWHRRSVAELERLARHRPERTRTVARVSVDPTVLLRAVAIVLIVGTHANLLTVMGGAHALLAVCGYNAARFLPTSQSPARALLRGAWNVALPSALWIGTLAAYGFYAPTAAVFLNGALGEDRWTIEWQFWFLEAAIWTLVGMAVAFSIRPVRRLDAAHPFGSALLLLAATAALRYLLVGVDTDPVMPERYSTPVVAWCFVLGWAAARATTRPGRWTVFASSVLFVHGFFGDPMRELFVVAAVAILLWARPVRLPRWAARAMGALAAASLAIYLTHWQVYPHLEDRYPLLATLSSLVVGLAYHRLCGVVGRVAVGLRRRIALDVDRRVQRGADEHRDRQDVQQQKHRDGRGQRPINGRSGRPLETQHPAHEVAADDPHHEGEHGTGDPQPPRLPDRHRHVVQRRHEADREHENGRPVQAL
jgi:acyl-CoA synthetase (AMP-forming)/AMP-acid ligase II